MTVCKQATVRNRAHHLSTYALRGSHLRSVRREPRPSPTSRRRHCFPSPFPHPSLPLLRRRSADVCLLRRAVTMAAVWCSAADTLPRLQTPRGSQALGQQDRREWQSWARVCQLLEQDARRKGWAGIDLSSFASFCFDFTAIRFCSSNLGNFEFRVHVAVFRS